MAIVEIDDVSAIDADLVGPVVRAGPLAEAIIEAVADDNPGSDVLVVDRGDYVRVHTAHVCRLSRASLQRHLGAPFELSALEIEMPSFKGSAWACDGGGGKRVARPRRRPDGG